MDSFDIIKMDNDDDQYYNRDDFDSWRRYDVSWTSLVRIDEIHIDHSSGNAAADDIARRGMMMQKVVMAELLSQTLSSVSSVHGQY